MQLQVCSLSQLQPCSPGLPAFPPPGHLWRPAAQHTRRVCCLCTSLQGGWNLTEAIYDYSAKLPMAQVLSWERPRLVRLC